MFSSESGMLTLVDGLLLAAALCQVAVAFVLRRREGRWFVFPWFFAAGLAGQAVSSGTGALWGIVLGAFSMASIVVAAVLMARRARHLSRLRKELDRTQAHDAGQSDASGRHALERDASRR